MKEFPQKIKSLEQSIEGYQADIDQRKRNTESNEDGFSPMIMPGGTVREKKAAGDAILARWARTSSVTFSDWITHLVLLRNEWRRVLSSWRIRISNWITQKRRFRSPFLRRESLR